MVPIAPKTAINNNRKPAPIRRPSGSETNISIQKTKTPGALGGQESLVPEMLERFRRTPSPVYESVASLSGFRNDSQCIAFWGGGEVRGGEVTPCLREVRSRTPKSLLPRSESSPGENSI